MTRVDRRCCNIDQPAMASAPGYRSRRRVGLTVCMRATQQEQVGGAGVSEVTAAFERLGWGTVENARHDLGTDLFVLARDERLFDLGLVVGVQVKTGDSYFDEPGRVGDDLDIEGWWFRDNDRSHVDAWVSHGLPHLLVLHDLGTKTSYWAHVTADAVVPTGKGAKVFVPAANTVDDGHREALLAVASTLRPGVAWEGSAWTSRVAMAPRDVLRHALVVPRLVAPHPNAGPGAALRPEQAAALLVQARVRDLQLYAAECVDVPTLAEAVDSPVWTWRFVGALGQRLIRGDISLLMRAVDDSPDPASRAAATVAAASALIERGQVDEAVMLIEAALARDDSEPVDHAWLTLQHARACADIGRLDEARADAVKVQSIRLSAPDDLTATAIAGVAAVLLFNTSAWGESELADRIAGADTAVAWWRNQTTSHALAALADRTFKSWARDSAVTFGASDPVNDQLVAAAQMASYVGDNGDWRRLSALLGRDELMRLERDSDADQAHGGLRTLRLAGDESAIKLAVRRFAQDGPAAAVPPAAAEVRLDASTRTTARADLALLQCGGDLLDYATADQAVGWLVATLRDPRAFATRTRPSYPLDVELVDTLAAVVRAAGPSARSAVRDHLVNLPVQKNQLPATSWARVADALPDETWTTDAATRLAQGADAHHAVLRTALLGVAARFDAAANARLVDEACGGSLLALGGLGDLRDLSPGVARKVSEAMAERVERVIRDAQPGHTEIGVQHVGHALALINVWYPVDADWDVLLAMLSNENVAANHKLGAIGVLGAFVDRIPLEIRGRVGAVAVAGCDRPIVSVPFSRDLDVACASADLAAALGVLDTHATGARLLSLLAGGADERQWAARLARRLGRTEDTGVLLALAQDRDPGVRAAAGAGLAFLVAAEQGGGAAADGLWRCVRDSGTRVPAAVADWLAHAPDRGEVAQDALARLCTHASAYVRGIAVRALAQPPGGRTDD
jgi:tetratricopeptide (TPR) repeat protein